MSICIEKNVCIDFSLGSCGEPDYHDISGESEINGDPFSLPVI